MYYYSPLYLEFIADNYWFYQVAETGTHRLDSKLDFDTALDKLGKGHWDGDVPDIIKGFSADQYRIIQRIKGESDFDDYRIFKRMASILNGSKSRRLCIKKLKEVKMFNTQKEYNQFYDRMKRYGLGVAQRLFLISRLDAVENALDHMVDELLKSPDIEDMETWEKKVIENYLKNEHRENVHIESPPLIEIPKGFHELIIPITSNPKVRIMDMPDGKKKEICMMHWLEGMKQQEIADKLGVSKQYISKVLQEYRS